MEHEFLFVNMPSRKTGLHNLSRRSVAPANFLPKRPEKSCSIYHKSSVKHPPLNEATSPSQRKKVNKPPSLLRPPPPPPLTLLFCNSK